MRVSRIIRFPTIALLFFFSLGLTGPPSEEVRSGAEPVTVEVVASTWGQVDDLVWALTRMGQAKLELPPLTVVFHETYEPCGMRRGVLRILPAGFEIHQCEREAARIRYSLLHELVHAWDYGTDQLTSDTRDRFLQLRGLTAWFDTTQDWEQRGVEQAAEIVVWGLMEQQAPIPSAVGDAGANDTASLEAVFETLTGRLPLWADNPTPSISALPAEHRKTKPGKRTTTRQGSTITGVPMDAHAYIAAAFASL